MAHKTLLELDTAAPERAVIKIDGNAYELRSIDDLGLKEDAEFRGTLREFNDAQPGQDWGKMAGLLDRMLQSIVLGLPQDVLARLSDGKKLKIIEVFIKEVGMIRNPPSQAPAAEAVAST